jgi:predicted metal-binding membrane protein
MTHPGALISAGAWAATLALAARLGNAPGTMGLGVVAFLGAWAVMMTAMMLPTVSTESSAVVEASDTGRGTRDIVLFSLSYLAVWAAMGPSVFWLAAGAGSLAAKHGAAATGAAAVILAACGLYQLSSIKRGFLMRCRDASKRAGQGVGRSPLGPARAGVGHAASCVASSWALMALIVVFGVMNVYAMAAVAAAIYAERTLRRGVGISHIAGLACLGCAIVALFHPAFAGGLHQFTTGVGT